VRVPDEPIVFADRWAGRQRMNLATLGGDFVIYKKDDQAAYQLAVVVDDAACGVDAIVRGDDLLDSTPRQILLRRLLGLGPEPVYWHAPLVVGPDGRRLAKRHGDTRLATYRTRGATPQRILGLLGYWCGLLTKRRPTEMDELRDRFNPTDLPREPIIYTEADDRFLLGE
jgi:glutamyl-tRNA synthetase